jgi:hypothetical protein
MLSISWPGLRQPIQLDGHVRLNGSVSDADDEDHYWVYAAPDGNIARFQDVLSTSLIRCLERKNSQIGFYRRV